MNAYSIIAQDTKTDLLHDGIDIHAPLSVLYVTKPGDDLSGDRARNLVVVSKSSKKLFHWSGVMFHRL